MPDFVEHSNLGRAGITRTQGRHTRLECTRGRLRHRQSSSQRRDRPQRTRQVIEHQRFDDEELQTEAFQSCNIGSTVAAFPADDEIRPQCDDAFCIYARGVTDLRQHGGLRRKITVARHRHELRTGAGGEHHFRDRRGQRNNAYGRRTQV